MRAFEINPADKHARLICLSSWPRAHQSRLWSSYDLLTVGN